MNLPSGTWVLLGQLLEEFSKHLSDELLSSLRRVGSISRSDRPYLRKMMAYSQRLLPQKSSPELFRFNAEIRSFSLWISAEYRHNNKKVFQSAKNAVNSYIDHCAEYSSSEDDVLEAPFEAVTRFMRSIGAFGTEFLKTDLDIVTDHKRVKSDLLAMRRSQRETQEEEKQRKTQEEKQRKPQEEKRITGKKRKRQQLKTTPNNASVPHVTPPQKKKLD